MCFLPYHSGGAEAIVHAGGSAREYAALVNLRWLLNVCAKLSYVFLTECKYLAPVDAA